MVVSHQMLRFQLNLTLLGEMPEREKVAVWCRTEEEGEEHQLQLQLLMVEEEEESYQAELEEVRPDTEYFCHGQVNLRGGEVIEIPQTVVHTQEEVEAEVEVEVTQITEAGYRYEVWSPN